MLKALKRLEEVIEIVKKAKDSTSAKDALTSESFGFTEEQVNLTLKIVDNLYRNDSFLLYLSYENTEYPYSSVFLLLVLFYFILLLLVKLVLLLLKLLSFFIAFVVVIVLLLMMLL